ESRSGWQQVNFKTPVAITANTVYVASYHIWGLALAFGIKFPVVSAVVVSAVLGLGLMVPAAPGGLGTYELAGVAGLQLIGVDASSAAALTLVIHAWVFVTNVGGGLFLLACGGMPAAGIRGSPAGRPPCRRRARPA